MGSLKRGAAIALVSFLTVGGLFASVVAYRAVASPDFALAQESARGYYTASTAELPIPAPGNRTGNLQEDIVCDPGDLAVGGGHIIHPSSTTGISVTKSYATDATGAFAPAIADRWRVKVLNPGDSSGVRLTVHAACVDASAIPARMDANNFVAPDGTGFRAFAGGRDLGLFPNLAAAEQAYRAAFGRR